MMGISRAAAEESFNPRPYMRGDVVKSKDGASQEVSIHAPT